VAPTPTYFDVFASFKVVSPRTERLLRRALSGMMMLMGIAVKRLRLVKVAPTAATRSWIWVAFMVVPSYDTA